MRAPQAWRHAPVWFKYAALVLAGVVLCALLGCTPMAAQVLDSIRTDSIPTQHYDVIQRLYFTRVDTLRLPRDTTGGGERIGVAFGHFEQPVYSSRLTGGTLVLSRHEETRLPQAHDMGAQVWLNVTGATSNQRCALDGSGTFSLSLWDACFRREAQRARAIVAAYGDSGTVGGIYILDEPNHPSRWGPPGSVTPQMIEQMCGVSKEIWPRIPCYVRAAPEWLAGQTYVHLDGAWAQYAARRGDVVAYARANVDGARRLGLCLVFSLNALHGGATSLAMATASGDSSYYERFMPTGNLFALGPRALRGYGEALLEAGGTALLLWEYDPADPSWTVHPEIAPVIDALAGLALRQPARPCTWT